MALRNGESHEILRFFLIMSIEGTPFYRPVLNGVGSLPLFASLGSAFEFSSLFSPGAVARDIYVPVGLDHLTIAGLNRYGLACAGRTLIDPLFALRLSTIVHEADTMVSTLTDTRRIRIRKGDGKI